MLSSLLATTPYHERGVIYFSSIPRNMRPVEVRLHFNRFGDITRMRFVPLPKKERRPGGPLLPLQFKEAWLEFAHADAARRAAKEMNSTPVECKRQRRCFGQLWTVKYLQDFRWDMLAEERECERRMRRANEVQARSAERQANELYRKMAMTRMQCQRRHTTLNRSSDHGHDASKQQQPCEEEKYDQNGEEGSSGTATAMSLSASDRGNDKHGTIKWKKKKDITCSVSVTRQKHGQTDTCTRSKAISLPGALRKKKKKSKKYVAGPSKVGKKVNHT